MLYSRRDLDARKQNRIESGHRRSQTLPCQDPPRKDRSPYMWEGVWCEESRCPDVQYSCIYVSVTPQSSVHGNTARRSSGAFRLLRRKVRHFAAECVLPWFAGEFAKRARLHTSTRLRILPAGFTRSWGKGNFCHRTMTAVSMHGWKGVKEFLLGCQCFYGRSYIPLRGRCPRTLNSGCGSV